MKFKEEALKYLNLGINSEIAAYVFYKKAARLIGDASLRKTLEDLAKDEKNHFLSLEEEYDRNVRSEIWAPYKDILGKPGLPDIDELVQETHKELLGKIGALKTAREVLTMALGLEKEAFALFSDAASRAKESELKKIFDYLASFEKGHVNLIEKALAGLK